MMPAPSVPLHHLPVRSLSAAANMAVDTLLLEAYPQPQVPRFRHYGWSDPAFTFGRTQAWERARVALPVHVSWQDAHERFASTFQLVRRPTGGGIVDHRNDWTYALVIPAGHPLARTAAGQVYRDCHHVLVAALAAQGVAAALEPCAQACAQAVTATLEPESNNLEPCEQAREGLEASAQANAAAPSTPAEHTAAASALAGDAPVPTHPGDKDDSDFADSSVSGACFTRAEPYDVVAKSGAKLAGAAQRRTRDGLLVQGSVSRAEVGELNWQRFERDVVEGFARWLALSDGLAVSPPQPASVLVQEVSFPKWASEQLKATVARFASPQWNRRR